MRSPAADWPPKRRTFLSGKGCALHARDKAIPRSWKVGFKAPPAPGLVEWRTTVAVLSGTAPVVRKRHDFPADVVQIGLPIPQPIKPTYRRYPRAGWPPL